MNSRFSFDLLIANKKILKTEPTDCRKIAATDSYDKNLVWKSV